MSFFSDNHSYRYTKWISLCGTIHSCLQGLLLGITLVLKMLQYKHTVKLFSLFFCSLGASSSGAQGVGQKKKGELASTSLSGIWILPPIPLWLSFDWAVRFLPVRGTPDNFSVPSSFHVSITHEYEQKLMVSFLHYSNCRAPFNLVVGFLAIMFLGFFYYFF